jgi:ferric-dicitrate binding protein FerR (iron transport regulator)
MRIVYYMNATRRALAAALPLLSGLSRPGAAQPRRPRVGEVTAVTGTALAHFVDEPPRRLEPEAGILLEDMLATDPDARLACRLLGGIELRLGGNATLRVDRLALRGPRPGVGLSSLSGPLVLDRPAPAPRGAAVPISLDLPWARIGVRGTRFFAGPLDEVFAVFCARGALEVALPGGGPRAVLAAGEGVDVPRRPGPAPPVLNVHPWGAARIARAFALVE